MEVEISDEELINFTRGTCAKKLKEGGKYTVSINNIGSDIVNMEYESKFIEDTQSVQTFGFSKCILDKCFELAFSVMDSGQYYDINVWFSDAYQKLYKIQPKICVKAQIVILDAGKLPFECSTEEKFDMASTLKEEAVLLIKNPIEDNLLLKFAFYFLNRALLWLSFIHPKLKTHAATLLKDQCLLNLTYLHLKFKNFEKVVLCASESLQTDSQNIKALYRRGVANLNLQNYELARTDFEIILSKEPTNRAVLKELKDLRIKEKEYENKCSIAMKKLFS